MLSAAVGDRLKDGWCAVQVVQSLQALYDKHKGSYGWEDRPLSIE